MVIDSCDPLCGSWKLNSGPLEKPSLQPKGPDYYSELPFKVLKRKSWLLKGFPWWLHNDFSIGHASHNASDAHPGYA